MSKKRAYQFFGTLPPTPTQVFLEEWNEFIIKRVTAKNGDD